MLQHICLNQLLSLKYYCAMDYSSDDESDISESEINEYAHKPYEQLTSGFYKVKSLNGALRCPFCAGKKKQDYKYKDLLQHSSGVAKGSSNRRARQKANHLALANYLETQLAGELDQPFVPKPLPLSSDCNQLYVWPWVGIVVNIVTTGEKAEQQWDDDKHWLERFSKYKPVGVHVLTRDGDGDSSASAIVKFNDDWYGFMNAMEFEKELEFNNHGNKEWTSAIKAAADCGSGIFGWCATSQDYEAQGPVGDYLRETGKLTTVNDIFHEAAHTRSTVVTNLTDQLDITNEALDNLRSEYNTATLLKQVMVHEREKLQMSFLEGFSLTLSDAFSADCLCSPFVDDSLLTLMN